MDQRLTKPVQASRQKVQQTDIKARLCPVCPNGFFNQAIELREALYRIFVSISDQGDMQEVAPADLEILTKNWRQATQSLKITQSNGKLQWDWDFRAGDLGRVLWLVAQSAVELLESDQMDRIGQCQDDRGCGFLFLDTSRNRSRRWCSMESCGNRAKAHRHYAKAKK